MLLRKYTGLVNTPETTSVNTAMDTLWIYARVCLASSYLCCVHVEERQLLTDFFKVSKSKCVYLRANAYKVL